MGTRNLTIVFMDGEYRVAQYGQWDGYPEGQGMTCLEFLRNEMDEQLFRDNLKALEFIDYDSAQCKYINKAIEAGVIFPEFSRDTGAEILSMIQNRQTITRFLDNRIRFAACGDCEWAWVIDLDKRTFESYEGWNTVALTEEDRFYFLSDEEDPDDGYHAVKIVASWPLDNLPGKKQFLEAFKSEDDNDG